MPPVSRPPEESPPARRARAALAGPHAEWAPLVALLLAATLAWGFVALADGVAAGRTHQLDTRLLLALRNPDDRTDPLGPRWFEEVMRDLTALGGLALLGLLTLVLTATLAMLRKPRGATFLLAAVLGAQALSFTMKAAYDRPRPDLVPHGSITLTRSFPSGHSTMAAATYLTLGAMLARMAPTRGLRLLAAGVATLLTVGVGVSRVYLGVHWPTDVLAGWAVGAGWALGCWAVAAWLQSRGAMEGDDTPPPRATP